MVHGVGGHAYGAWFIMLDAVSNLLRKCFVEQSVQHPIKQASMCPIYLSIRPKSSACSHVFWILRLLVHSDLTGVAPLQRGFVRTYHRIEKQQLVLRPSSGSFTAESLCLAAGIMRLPWRPSAKRASTPAAT